MNKPIFIIIFFLFKSFFGYSSIEIAVVYNQQSGYVEISCNTKLMTINTFATLQRSSNNSNWQDLHSQKIKHNSKFAVTDRSPEIGKIYYRFKFSSNKMDSYSNSSFIIINEPADDWNVYPNPVTDVLTIQYKGITNFKGLYNVYVYNAHKNIVTRMRFASNQRILKIPVTNLTKGIYVAQIFVEEKMVGYEPFSKL